MFARECNKKNTVFSFILFPTAKQNNIFLHKGVSVAKHPLPLWGNGGVPFFLYFFGTFFLLVSFLLCSLRAREGGTVRAGGGWHGACQGVAEREGVCV